MSAVLEGKAFDSLGVSLETSSIELLKQPINMVYVDTVVVLSVMNV